MAIGTGQVSLEDIRIEVGTARPISLGELSSKTWKGGEANYASFKETRSYGRSNTYSTAVAAQGTGLAGLNAPPYGVSEFKGYDHETASSIGAATTANVFYTSNVLQEEDTSEPQTSNSGTGCEIYCTKSGSTVSIIVSSLWSGSTIFIPGHATAQDASASATVATLSGSPTTVTLWPSGVTESIANASFSAKTLMTFTTATNITGCVMSFDVISSDVGAGTWSPSSGDVFYTATDGATSTSNLTDTKIGYRINVGGGATSWFGDSNEVEKEYRIIFTFTGSNGSSGGYGTAMFTQPVYVYLSFHAQFDLDEEEEGE